MLTGLLKPAIVLPVSVLQHPENLSFIFRHELIHYKRKDIWFKWLFQLVECVHFFNPFAYLLRRQVERCCELSCDEAVVKDMTFQERKAYGTTLLDALESGIFSRTPAASASLCENAAFIKERLVMIKMNRKKALLLKLSRLCLPQESASAPFIWGPVLLLPIPLRRGMLFLPLFPNSHKPQGLVLSQNCLLRLIRRLLRKILLLIPMQRPLTALLF